MRDEALSQFTGGGWMTAAMIIFIVLFVVFAAWTWRRSAKHYYERMARMPLDRGGHNDNTGT
jgi:cbb3-type cytochrome oxidase subunit 3